MKQSHKQKRIQRLSPLLVDRIAAGEVIEGPASVIKELVENSIDAGARQIRIATTGAGMGSIIIEDDGNGIDFDQLPLSVERHATSKIHDLEDIDTVLSYGFRGEALASIASISALEVHSATDDSGVGGLLVSRGGEISRHEKISQQKGTVIYIEDLFYSVPARRKFVKSEKGENKKIYTEILQVALAHPEVSLYFERDGKTILDLEQTDNLKSRIEKIYRRDMARRLISVTEEIAGLHMHGYVSAPSFHKTNREGQFLFVNNRPVQIKNLPFLIRKLYGERIPSGSFPYFFLFFDIDPLQVDVNVHPAKREVRFQDEKLIHAVVVRALKETFQESTPLTLSSIPHTGPFSIDGPAAATAASDGEDLPGQDHQSRQYEKNNYSGLVRAQQLDFSVATEPMESSYAEAPGSMPDPNTDQTSGATARGSSVRGNDSEGQGIQNGLSKTGEDFLPDFSRLQFNGVLFKTYILVQSQDILYIIDQHTAHERVNFEKIRSQLRQSGHEAQTLLHPVVVKCNEYELENVLDHTPYLGEHGFGVEPFGNDSYIIRSVPFFVDPGEEENVVSSLIEKAMGGIETVQVFDEYAAMKACRASVKRNDVINEGEARELVQRLLACEQPARCPHGRPTIIRVTIEEFDRMFMRIE